MSGLHLQAVSDPVKLQNHRAAESFADFGNFSVFFAQEDRSDDIKNDHSGAYEQIDIKQRFDVQSNPPFTVLPRGSIAAA